MTALLRMATKKTTPAVPAVPAPEAAYQYNATVLRVVDGDTAEVDIDLGFKVHVHATVRLDGIDAPEKFGATKEAGMVAKNALTKLLPPGCAVVLKTRKPADKSDEKYGRLLARVWVSGKDLSQVLLDERVVSAYSGTGPRTGSTL